MNRILPEALHRQVVEALYENTSYDADGNPLTEQDRRNDAAIVALQATAQEPSTAQPQPAAQAAPGWKLVPIVATGEMGRAGEKYAAETRDRPKGSWWWRRLCEAMISASPQPAVAQGDWEMRDAPANTKGGA